jgi:hypothetical protein
MLDRDVSTNGIIEIRRLEQHNEGEDILLEALVTYRGIETGLFVRRKHSLIVQHHSVGYMQNHTDGDGNHLAVITVPMEFNGDKLQESVDAAVNILKDMLRLQKSIASTIISFKI